MKLAICLITADRYEYTDRTLLALAGWMERKYCLLIQADDASKDPRVLERAKYFGFENITTHKERLGGQKMRQLAIAEAARRGATHVFVLENDIEMARPFPWDVVKTVFEDPQIYCIRLYGRYKERGEKRACGKTHFGKGRRDPGWMDVDVFGEKLQIGDIHWGAQPCITRIWEAVWLHEGTRSESQIRKKCGQLTALTARFMDNVCYHIGDDRTPEFQQ